MSKTVQLRVPCCYQGGKQRIAGQIVDRLLSVYPEDNGIVRFYDMCCGSGAISIELLNRGIKPQQITMLDASSWGTFWKAIGEGEFDLAVFKEELDRIPKDKREIKTYMTALANEPLKGDERYIYPILQSCSFGGKQIWLKNGRWTNAFFRDYWEPTASSVRKSPANPMQPAPETLYRRVRELVKSGNGITCLKENILDFAYSEIDKPAVVYVDPPYRGTTSYGFNFDLNVFVEAFKKLNDSPLFISEGIPLGSQSEELTFGGAKGGISGNKPKKHREWITRF